MNGSSGLGIMDPRDLASAKPKDDSKRERQPKDDRMNGFSGLADANPRMTRKKSQTQE